MPDLVGQASFSEPACVIADILPAVTQNEESIGSYVLKFNPVPPTELLRSVVFYDVESRTCLVKRLLSGLVRVDVATYRQ